MEIKSGSKMFLTDLEVFMQETGINNFTESHMGKVTISVKLLNHSGKDVWCMQNQTHSDLEEMQRKLKRQWASRAKKKVEIDPNTIKPTDSLVVLHAEELEFMRTCCMKFSNLHLKRGRRWL